MKGFIILQESEYFVNKYLSHPFTVENQANLQVLRERFNFLHPANYQGIGRTFLDSMPFWPDDNGQIINESTIPDSFNNIEARFQLAKIKYSDSDFVSAESSFYFKLEKDMKAVFSALENPSLYDWIEIDNSSGSVPDTTTIGYDIGTLDGYSIICDTCIAPLWHAPDLADMEDIVTYCKRLNSTCLFENYEDAKLFMDLYKSKKWGEKGSFDIYKINKYY